jgi:hypothetical protein
MTRYFSRSDIAELADRLEARGTSKMLRKDQPHLCADLRNSAALLRWMLDHGMPVTGV